MEVFVSLMWIYLCPVAMTAQLVVTDTTPEEKVLRSRHHVIPVSASLVALPAARKRKQLTPEELEQRRKKVNLCKINSIRYSSIID